MRMFTNLNGLLLIIAMVAVCGSAVREPKKRQIYREQVLPHKGGKIPDTAFNSDRLILNQLQQDGIAIPDGVVFQKRNPHVNPYTSKSQRPIFRVTLTSDNRYVDPAGRYYDFDQTEPHAVDTTYAIPVSYKDHNYKTVYHFIKTQRPNLGQKFKLPSNNGFSLSDLDITKGTFEYLGTQTSNGNHQQYYSKQQGPSYYNVVQHPYTNQLNNYNAAPTSGYSSQLYNNYNPGVFQGYNTNQVVQFPTTVLPTSILPPPITNYNLNRYYGYYKKK